MNKLFVAMISWAYLIASAHSSWAQQTHPAPGDLVRTVPACSSAQPLPSGGKQSAEEAMVFIVSGGMQRDLSPFKNPVGITFCYEVSGQKCTITKYTFDGYASHTAKKEVLDFNKFIPKNTAIENGPEGYGGSVTYRFTFKGEQGAVMTQMLTPTNESYDYNEWSITVRGENADNVVKAMKYLYSDYCSGSKSAF